MSKLMRNIYIRSFASLGKYFLWKLQKIKTRNLKDLPLSLFTNKKMVFLNSTFFNLLAKKAKDATNHEVLLINRIRVTFKKNIREL